MHRCAARASSTGASRRLVLAALGGVGLLAALPAGAQHARRFPRNALRGEIRFAAYPELLLNGQPARLSPASRVRDMANMIAMPATLQGNRVTVHYTLDSMGLLHEVWILTREEIAKLWPRTPQEAAAWVFDEPSQTWSRP